jgi:hypothetical protein
MSDIDRAKLARILGMLGSEHAGERASAALQAEAFRKRHGMTWEEMLALPAVEVVVESVWTPPIYDPRHPKVYPFIPPHARHPFTWRVDERWKAVAFVVAWVGGAVLINVI